MEVRGQSEVLFFRNIVHPPPTDSVSSLGLTSQPRLAHQQAPGSFLAQTPQHWDYRYVFIPPHARQTLSQLSDLPSHEDRISYRTRQHREKQGYFIAAHPDCNGIGWGCQTCLSITLCLILSFPSSTLQWKQPCGQSSRLSGGATDCPIRFVSELNRKQMPSQQLSFTHHKKRPHLPRAHPPFPKDPLLSYSLQQSLPMSVLHQGRLSVPYVCQIRCEFEPLLTTTSNSSFHVVSFGASLSQGFHRNCFKKGRYPTVENATVQC